MQRRVRLIHDSRTCNVARHVLCDPGRPLHPCAAKRASSATAAHPHWLVKPSTELGVGGWAPVRPRNTYINCEKGCVPSCVRRCDSQSVAEHVQEPCAGSHVLLRLSSKTSSRTVSWSASHASWASSIEFVAAHRSSGPTLRGDLNPADQSTVSLFLDPSPKQVHPVRECDSGDGDDARNTWEPKKLAEESASVLWPGDPDLAGRRGGREGGSGKVSGHVPDKIEFGLFVTSVNCNGKFELQVGSVRCKLHCVREASPKPIPSFDMKGHI